MEYLSPNSVELGGLDPAGFEAWGGVARWVEAIDPTDRPPIVARFRETVSEGFEPDVTYRITLPDGRRAFVRDRCQVVRDRLGRPVSLHGMLTDVTKEREAQLEMQEHARRFRDLLDNAELGAVMIDLAGRLTFVNGTFLKTTGFPKATLLGASWFDAMVPSEERDAARLELLGRLAEGIVPARTEHSIWTLEGQRRRMVWTHILLRRVGGGAEGIASLGVDLTDRDQAEQRRHHTERLASLGHLAAGVAHDLNNLIQVLITTSYELAGVSPEAKVLAGEQQVALDQGRALVASLLGFAKGHTTLSGRCLVDEQLRTLAPILSRMANPCRLELLLGAPGAAVGCDGPQLQQVVHNLVSNAVAASNGREGPIQVQSEVQALPAALSERASWPADTRLARISVKDRGRGIPPHLLERIFEPFFTSQQDRGTGLGLSTVRSVVQAAGGLVHVESEVGQGTVFEVWLPLAGPAE